MNPKRKIKWVYQEEFQTKIKNASEKELKSIFQQKYLAYIQRLENRKLER